jgi:Fe-Mn family superoxide dismutase
MASSHPVRQLDNSAHPALNRRGFLLSATLAAGAATSIGMFGNTRELFAADEKEGAYKLPPLPCAFDALEPFIDAKTMEIHHDKHHATYVTKLNEAVAGSDLGKQPVESLLMHLDTVPEKIRQAVINHGGGHANHSLFWQLLKKDGGQPSAELKSALEGQLGGMDKFKEDFTKAAVGRFGSGWAWLCIGADKKLAIESTANQDSPLSSGKTPILGIDVWEHAYYLKYQNRRPEYVAAFFSVINWAKVSELFAQAVKS